ncbi:sulfotransferase 1A1-like [Ruditapes philippinarum]|uniref:sulfotransferase 1A1-like n=1 Tax=Ruditapes philippinarum TaxID=129788 RepID=UPI00295AA63F|nr:sulfotransferase 1A1-like [Ruditapes philippinarum]
MPRHVFKDVPDGDNITYDVVDEDNGYRQCTFSYPFEVHQDLFNRIPTIKCKDEDIILESYPKTGTHWLWEMIYLVKKGTCDVTEVQKGQSMIDASPIEYTENLPQPRVLNSHLKVKYLPKDVIEKKLNIVLLVRNPKDVAVSFYNHTRGLSFYDYDGKFENYLQMFMRGEVDYGSYPEYLREWQTFMKENPDVPIHLVYYENLHQDCQGEMKKVCKFLGNDVSDEDLQQIVSNCQIDKLRKGKMDKLPEEIKVRMGQMTKNDFSVFRKGKIGDWRNWFTVAQNETFDKWWEQETRDITMFSFKYR